MNPFNPTLDVDGHGVSNNGKRAERAAKALRAYRGQSKPDESDLSDLLCDLMHLCDREGYVFPRELDRGRSNYIEERGTL